MFDKIWHCPGGEKSKLCSYLLDQPHVLIAGATGSGKSVLINSIIHTILFSAPCQKKLVLIDPKRVELVKYRNLPHTMRYCSEIPDMIKTINDCVNMMEKRYQDMQRAGKVKSDLPDVYIIVDEFADLMTTCKKETLFPLCRIAQLGRAANIHLILATQRPTREIINGQIKVNMDCRIALRCPSQRDSINIIDCKGAETLPRYGFGYLSSPDGLQVVTIPKKENSDIHRLVKHWEEQNKPRWKIW